MRLYYPANIRFPMERANSIQILRTCHALARRGHEVHLAVRGGKGSDAEALAFYGLPSVPGLVLHRLPALDTGWSDWLWNRSFDVLAILLGLRLALLGGVKVVLLRDQGLGRAFLMLRSLGGAAVVFEVHQIGHRALSAETVAHGSASPDARRRERLARKERRLFGRADALVAITEGLATELREVSRPRGPVAVVPDAVAVEAFAGPRPVPGPRLTVGYVGQLYPWKGVDVLVEALAQAPDWRAVIVGGLPYEPDLERLKAKSAALGVAARVDFRGFRPPREVPTLYREFDAVALPFPDTTMGRRYTSPLKLFEGMAAGCPIVASDLPSLREVLRDGETALLVPPGDPRALAGALARLAADPGLGARLAGNARAAASAYSWDARASRLEVVLTRACGKAI